MKKYYGTRYNSRWDWSTWLIIGIVATCCIIHALIDDEIWPIVIYLTMLIFNLLVFLGIYYRIDGNKLVVYTFFIPTAYPIDKINEIKPTDSVLSAPATSLTHRLAITFTDRQILKSTTPLIISPLKQKEFIKELCTINPAIRH